MTTPISSNISSVQLFNATNAFKKATAQKQDSLQENFLQEEVTAPKESAKMFANHNIDEIRKYAQEMGEENLSNDDIKYGLFYGRSVIVDYSV